MSKLTIKEIAKMSNTSTATVSFVINNKVGVSEETRKKVTDIIEKTGYKPNINSKRLYFKKTYNIAIVYNQKSSPFDDLFYFEISRGVLERTILIDYNLVFSLIKESSSSSNSFDLPGVIKNRDCDGIIFYQDINPLILKEVDKIGIPYVIVDSHITFHNSTYINIDYQSSAYTATKFLINNGHKNIAFIGSSFISDFYVQTFSGFKNALEEAELTINPAWIQINAIDKATSCDCMKRILNAKSMTSQNIPSAVFCSVDSFAINAIKYLQENGYRVPDDYSFIGIDDIILSSLIYPSLTTVKIDKLQLGRLAMELLEKKMYGEAVDSITLKMNDLMIRDSVKIYSG